MSRANDSGEMYVEVKSLRRELAEMRQDLNEIGCMLIEVRDRLRRAHVGDPPPAQPDDGA